MATRELILDIHEKRSGNAMTQAANDLDKLGRGLDATGTKFAHTATDLDKLDVQIIKTRDHIKDLQVQVARTGDTSLFGDLRKEESMLRNLERTREAIAQAAENGLQSGFASGVSALGSSGSSSKLTEGISTPIMAGVIGGLTTAVVLGAPTLGAMIAGLVAGTIGTGGVAGGVLMSTRDPHVRAAFSELKAVFLDEFFAQGDLFVKPVLTSVHFLERALKEINIGGAFSKNADEIYTIAHGIGDLAYNLMPGLNKAFDRMGPFADAAAEGLGELGASLGDFLDSVTASPGAVMGLEAAFNLVNNVIRATGGFLEWLSNGFERFVAGLHSVAIAILATPGIPDKVKEGAQGLANATEDLWTHGIKFNSAADEGAHVIESFGEAADTAAFATKIFADALGGSYDKFLDWTGAEINAEEAIDNFQEAIEESGGSLDVHEEKGRRALDMLKRLAEAALEAAKKKYIETQSVDDANAVYDSYRQQIYDTFVAMGKTAEEAQELTDKWLALQKLEDITLTANLQVNSSAVDNYLAGNIPHGFVQGYASGGDTPAFEPFRVHDGEVMFSSRSHYVANRAQVDAMSGMGGGGGPSVNISFAATGDPFLDAMIRELRKFIRIDSGGDVQVSLGR